MKKLILILLFSVLVIPQLVVAAPNINQYTGTIAEKSGFDSGTDKYTMSKTVGKYISIALSLVGTIFLVLVVYAGILWMTASGNEESVTKATGILKMAIIGLIITLGAYSITAFVIDKL